MDGDIDETSHVMFLGKFENNKKYKGKIIQEIIVVICAMLNSNGGKVVIHIDADWENGKPTGILQMSSVIRILEQSMISIIGLRQTILKIDFEAKDSIVISIEKADSLITINYNLYLPSETQVVQVSPLEPLENVQHIIINRKVVMKPVQLGSHCKIFLKGKPCGFHERKMVQFKQLKTDPSKRTTLADRMTGKGNKFSCYVAAFANHNGGHIYYGITHNFVVEGEFIPNEKLHILEIVKKVEKAINKLIWPEQIGQPKRGVHWDIFFESMVDENSKPIPSTFVIVIYIAPCLGGVFTEEPECYEMVEGKVMKMSFTTWKRRLHPGWSPSREEIPRSVKRISWSSAKVRKDFTVEGEKLRQLINNGDWNAFSKECQILQRKSQLCETKLLVLSKQVTASYRRGNFKKARIFLEQYNAILPQAQDRVFFEVMGLYLQAALKRASGDFEELPGLLTEALSQADLIEPGLVTAIVYVFAGTVTDLINSEGPSKKIDSPDVLSNRGLEHLRCVPDNSEVVANKEQKAHITLASFYLRCNISGRRIKGNVDSSDIDKAKTSILAVHESADKGHPLGVYHEVQFNLVLSIYNYRRSQVSPDQRTRSLRTAFEYAKKAECLATYYQFKEMAEWSKANKALCTEELVCSQFSFSRKNIQPENSLHE
jgi:hypothetical protein